MVLILAVLLALATTSNPSLNEEAADVLVLLHMMCTAAVMSLVLGFVYVSLIGQLVEWYHTSHVFGPVYTALVPCRSKLPAPSCGRRSLAHPRCVSSSSLLAHRNPIHSPLKK